MHYYQRFGIEYNIPTVGLYFSDNDFFKFCNNLQHYLKQPIKFVNAKESPAYEEVCRWGKIDPENNENFSFPVGMIDDITIWFMHYKTEEEALTKWSRRAARVDLNKILIKWSQRYTDDDETVDRFLEIPYPKFGIVDSSCKVSSTELVKLRGWRKLQDEGGDEISFDGRYVDTIAVINNAIIRNNYEYNKKIGL